MRLTVLGCAGTFPGPDGPCSGYLVEHDGYRLVLDLGAGALGQLQRHCGLLQVDAVYISHLHADHCIDLVAYAYARRYHPDGIPPRLVVYGPTGLAQRIADSFGVPPTDGLLEVFDFRELPTGPLQLGPFALTTAVVNHPVECHAVRVQADGRTLVYSADTGESQALVSLAQGADLLLCEASWISDREHPPGVHLTGRQAAEHAVRAGVRALLLTHLVAFVDPALVLAEAAAVGGVPVALARTGMSYLV